MCGIWILVKPKNDPEYSLSNFMKIKQRGPDNSCIQYYNSKEHLIVIGFHRLSIIDPINGNQPFISDGIILICNGEIYNYKELINKYKLSGDLVTGSDCEIILHLYKKIGIVDTINILDGVFAFVIYDQNKNEIIASRDMLGVRPLFYTFGHGYMGISSEAKALVNYEGKINPICPMKYLSYKIGDKQFTQDVWTTLEINSNSTFNLHSNIRDLFTKSIKKRLMSDRPIGCLLSGGLDSSIVAALVAKNTEQKIRTFTIGFEGATDIKQAEKVAKFIGSEHTTVIITEKEAIEAIKDVIYVTETYDVTTIRASVGQYLIAKYISENTDIKVIFNGDGADELMQGYIYFNQAPNAEEANKESLRLLKQIYKYDVLRVDRAISYWGLEARVPFLDKDFVKYYMTIKESFKWSSLEKKLFRDAFSKEKLLPKEILYRRKEAFSDGVSSKEKSWHSILQKHYNDKIIEVEYAIFKNNYDPVPFSKEAYYYRKKHEQYFGTDKCEKIEYWMPKWTHAVDPSARTLVNYIS